MFQKTMKVLNADVRSFFKKAFFNAQVERNRKFFNVLPAKEKKPFSLPVAIVLSICVLAIMFGGVSFVSNFSQTQAPTANILDTIKGWLPFWQEKVKPNQTNQGGDSFELSPQAQQPYEPQTTQEEMIISAVEKAMPAVVSIIITKDMPIYEQYLETQRPFGDSYPFEVQVPKIKQKGTQEQEVGSGSGFIVSKDGLIITNKHVVIDETAKYTVFTSDGKNYQAKVLGRDPVQDLALLKIEAPSGLDGAGRMSQPNFPILQLGDSSKVRIGQVAIAIGNALGEFSNTVSVGVISGKGRTITAEGAGISEILEDILQTDAAINKGNSGGPLLNLRGEVIGVNVAVAQEAQNIGFAVPINEAKIDIQQYQKQGKIARAFLGVRYTEITDELAKEKGLPVKQGALIANGEDANEPAVVVGSAADIAGLKEGDIIVSVSGEKITKDNTLGKIIRKHFPEDSLTLQILRNNQPLALTAILGNRSE